MKELAQIMNRFETATHYYFTWHAMNLRLKHSNPMLNSMLLATEGYLEKELIAELELGILEYQTWRSNHA